MEIRDLEEKLEYLNSLRPFTKEELVELRKQIIRINLSNNPRVGEIDGLKDAYSMIEYIIKEESSPPYPSTYHHPLTEDTLKYLNRAILNYSNIYLSCEKGFYRNGENDYIGDVKLPNREVFIPRLKELLKWYSNTDLDLLSKLTKFHLTFLADIHPFFDGNGRTARAILNLELARSGYPMIGLKYEDIDSYEKAIEKYNKSSNQEFMKRLIYERIDKELDKYISIKKSYLQP